MRYRVLTPTDYREVAWKNGQGKTQELVRYLHPGDRGVEFSWRMSIATISAANTFSIYPGVDRVILQLSGDAMALSVAGGVYQDLQPLVPFVFAGEAPISCRLSGSSARDFNVMVLRSRYRAKVRVHCMAQGDLLPLEQNAAWTIGYVQSGDIKVNGASLAAANEATIIVDHAERIGPHETTEFVALRLSTIVVISLVEVCGQPKN